MDVTFNALEYTIDGTFINSEYEFAGSVDSGWRIHRNNRHYLDIGKGYELLKTRLCGVCATDLSRRFLPFPLPQIIGHEVVAESLIGRLKYAVEINDTPYYRDDKIQDEFWKSGLYTHTPGRMVIGIDRLPGGFGPFLLAPQKAIVPISPINEFTAVLIEPFAAAFQAIIASPPENNEAVAVLGPRRLGSLLIAGLKAFKNVSGKNFKITALARHKNILSLCHKLGADNTINLADAKPNSLHKQFDIVYDTTGSVSGFELALALAKKEIHLKSTNGQNTCGLKNLTAFVVDELSLLKFNDTNLEFKWNSEDRTNNTVYFTPGTNINKISRKTGYSGELSTTKQILTGPDFKNRLPRFDIAVASTLGEIDQIIRPANENENSLVRPRGAILFKGSSEGNPLLDFISKGGRLRSSRCGDFHAAINLLKENQEIADTMTHYIISHMFPVDELNTAFQYAKCREAVKVVVKHIR